MSQLPGYEPMGLPPGKYLFKVKGEPEVRKATYAAKGRTFESKYIKIELAAKMPDGTGRKYVEMFFANEDRYRDLLLALGAKRSADGIIHTPDSFDTIGKVFEAEVAQVRDKKDPTKVRTRIIKIFLKEDEGTFEEEEEDIPEPGHNGASEAEGHSATADDDDIPF